MASAEEDEAPTGVVPAHPVPDARSDQLRSDRGSTVVAPGVIAAVARQAASEVDGVEAVGPTGLQGVLAPFRSSSAGGASAHVAARRAAIDLTVAVHWPRSVAEVTAAVRDHVQARVQELTGHQVTDVDIDVVDLPVPIQTRRRVS